MAFRVNRKSIIQMFDVASRLLTGFFLPQDFQISSGILTNFPNCSPGKLCSSGFKSVEMIHVLSADDIVEVQSDENVFIDNSTGQLYHEGNIYFSSVFVNPIHDTGYGFTSSYCVDVKTPEDNILVLTCFEKPLGDCHKVNISKVQIYIYHPCK